MTDIKKREQKIQEKRKNTPFRDYVKEIASRVPLNMYRFGSQMSRYPESNRISGILHIKDYEEQRLKFTDYGIDYDFDLPFFDNIKKLFSKVPYPARMMDVNAENSHFAEAIWKSNNTYLSFLVINDCENILYSFYVQDNVRNVINSTFVWDACDNIYQCTGVIKSFNVFYSKYIVNSADVRFSSNLIGCTECLFCDNLENKKYCIKNQEYTKEEYFAKKEELLSNKQDFYQYFKGINNHSRSFNSNNVSGEFCINSNDLNNAYFAYSVTNGNNLIFVGEKDGRRNVYDTFCSDEPGTGDIYACSNLGSVKNVYCSDCLIGQSLYYSFNCLHCSYCLGCNGLINKQFCIFNKQYTKEEWFKLADKIFEQMDKEGVLGQTFPGYLNPFYFNDTPAYLIDSSFTKEEVEAEGYLRRDEEIKVDIPEGAELVKSTELSQYQGRIKKSEQDSYVATGKPSLLKKVPDRADDFVRQIDPEILKKVIIDEQGNSYRIIKMEYDFLMKYRLPLPEQHWLDRIKMGFKFK